MKTHGIHIFADFWEVDSSKIDSVEFMENLFEQAAKCAELTIVKGPYSYKFNPYGLSTFVVISESHISCHTWPEEKFISLDIYTCGDKDPRIAYNYIERVLNPKKKKVKIIKRGVKCKIPFCNIFQSLLKFLKINSFK